MRTISQEDSYQELIDLRKTFESGLMQLLSERGLSTGRLDTLRALHKTFAEEVNRGDAERIIDADIDFHNALVEAAGNSLLI